MKDRSVHIHQIRIDRALGIRRGSGFELDDLSPSINLVFGPNGCGKSTTCKVAQELLWPGHLERPTISGLISNGPDDWRIEIDAGHVQSYLDGRAGPMPEFGPSESRRRYHLGLRDLIIDDSADFAKKIADASQGGYDLEAAATKLGFRERARARRSEFRELNERRGAVDKARAIQLEIQKDAERLDELSDKLKGSQEAERELRLLNEVKAYLELLDLCEELKSRLSTYPEGIARLKGDEKDQLEQLQVREKDLLDRMRGEEERIRRAQDQKEQADLPYGAIDKDLINELHGWMKDLRRLESRIEDQARRHDEAHGEVEQALRFIGYRLSEEQLASIESLENTDLSAFARKVHRVRAQRAVLDERKTWLAKAPPDDVESLSQEDLRIGIEALIEWLACQPGEQGDRLRTWIVGAAALLIFVLGIALAVVSGSWFITVVALLITFALYVADRRLSRQDFAGARARDVHRDAFARRPLPQPLTWDRREVAETLRKLGDLLGKRALADERRNRLDPLESEGSALTRAESEIDAERKQLEQHLGLALQLDDEWLPILVDRLSEWQSAITRLNGAAAARSELQQEADVVRGRLIEALAPYGYGPSNSSDVAEQQIAELASRDSGYRAAVKDISDARRAIEEVITPDMDGVHSTRQAIFDRLKIAAGEEYLLDDWIARRPAYLECAETLRNEKAVLESKKSVLADREDLLEIDRVELERRIDECAKRSEQRDELSETIGRINQSIADAKSGYELTDALDALDDAVADLEEARDENCRNVTGALLTDWVRRVAVERSRPAVFQRANELLVRFTRGTLRLEMDDRSSPPVFVARSGDQPAQSLNQLSDGERIQLMAAVRLAFLEQDESRPLPLLVDEVLGTSDDERSGIIIDTMIEVARQGRQVFYCTAQNDEVGKWIGRLNAEQVDYKLYDLAEIRRLSASRRKPLEITPVKKTVPPHPNGMSYKAYGLKLSVPAVDPLEPTVDRIHLWHLLDDTKTLYDLLSKGILTWGQFRTLIEHGGGDLIRDLDGAPLRARAAAKAIETACEAYRIGRGKPVDRAVLIDSGAVSEAFIDKVADLCYRLGGDAQALIEALERGDVSGFRRSKLDDLRDYFEDRDYLPLHEPLTTEKVRIRVMAAVAEELRNGLLDGTFVDQLVESLP